MNRIVIVAAGLASVVLSATASSQSLADLASKERERRSTLQAPSKTWTNAELRVYPPPDVVDVPRFDFASLLERTPGPTSYIDPYDKWWPFDGPPKFPERRGDETYVTFVGRPNFYARPSAGLWNRDGSREPHRRGKR